MTQQVKNNKYGLIRPLLIGAVLLMGAIVLFGCGEGGNGNGDPAATPAPGNETGLAENVAWQEINAFGGEPGDTARNATITLRDGSTATLEELADGRPLLLYFFVTW